MSEARPPRAERRLGGAAGAGVNRMAPGRSEGASAVPGGGEGGEGFEIAPGVRFSDKLWSRLGGKALEIEKQRRRDRMGDTSVVPDSPTAIFDPNFRNDATWRQR